MKFLAAVLVPGLVAAADLSTVLEVGVGEGTAPVTYTWTILAQPPGAGVPRLEPLALDGGPATHRVRAELPAAQPGIYRFQVEIRQADAVVLSQPIEVTVESGSSLAVAEGNDGGAGSGCASGSALLVVGALALVGRRVSRRA